MEVVLLLVTEIEVDYQRNYLIDSALVVLVPFQQLMAMDMARLLVLLVELVVR